MKTKLFLSLIFFVFIGALTLSQASFVNAISTNDPITGPITGPITSATYFIRGKVTFRLFKTNLTFPGSNVTIKTINQQTQGLFSTKTNSNGEYSFNLEQGQYTITPEQSGTKFQPAKRNVDLTTDTSGIDFKGTLGR